METPGDSGPIVAHVATDGEDALVLTGRPAAFDVLLARDGAPIDDGEEAVAAARTHQDLTRPSDRYGQVVDAPGDVRLRTDVDDAERRDLEAALEGVVVPPEAHADGDRWLVTLTYLDGDVLERRQVAVGTGGPVEVVAVDVLRSDLPVPFSL
ncbi:hypothetical protein FTX61_08855 [Nitriliruptoraceae bacterium ZYF776]|nr:hypothetical protein [Profundirhabdus halotolerans]